MLNLDSMEIAGLVTLVARLDYSVPMVHASRPMTCAVLGVLTKIPWFRLVLLRLRASGVLPRCAVMMASHMETRVTLSAMAAHPGSMLTALLHTKVALSAWGSING